MIFACRSPGGPYLGETNSTCNVFKCPLVARISFFLSSLVSDLYKLLIYGRTAKSRCEADGPAHLKNTPDGVTCKAHLNIFI